MIPQRHRSRFPGAAARRIASAVAAVLLAASAGAHAMSLREFHTLEASEKKEGKAYASYYLVGVL